MRITAIRTACAFLLALSSSAIAAPPPDAAALLSAEVGSPIVIGHSYVLRSTVLNGDRTLNVMLPADYGDGTKTFSVLVLLDGGVSEDFVHIAGLAQINAAYGEGQELIVIGVQGVDRRHDLTSPSSVPGDLKVAPTSGGAAAYRRFLVDELQPWVTSRFRTNGRFGIIGESLAGRFVLETLLTEPRDFSDYIAVSPSLWWNGGRLVEAAPSALRTGDFKGRKLSVVFETPAPPPRAAAKDVRLQDRMSGALRTIKAAGLRWTTTRLPDGHAAVYHPAALIGLRAIYGADSNDSDAK